MFREQQFMQLTGHQYRIYEAKTAFVQNFL